MSKRSPKMSVVAKPKFIPGRSYEWNSEDDFTLKGSEIKAISDALTAVTSSEVYRQHLIVANAANVFQNFFKEAVEEGLIREAKPQDKDAAIPEQ